MAHEPGMKTDVVILGGGLAGLSAAVGISDSGLRVVLLERDVRLGGRARSWVEPQTRDPIPIGPHVFVSEYPNMMALLRMLGTEDRIVWQRSPFIVIVRGSHETVVPVSSGLPPPLHLLSMGQGAQRVPPRHLLTNLQLMLLSLTVTEDDILGLDTLNALGLLRSLRADELSIRLWSFTSMALLNVPLALCSAGALIRLCRRMFGRRGYHFGFPDGGLGDLFAPQAQARIERNGGQVLLNTEATGFTLHDGQVSGVELADGRQVEARFCVSALPPAALRRMARPEWIERHRPFHDLVHFQPSPYVSTYLWFDRKLTRRTFWARSYDPNDLNCDFYDLSNINRGWADRTSVIATNCIYAERTRHLNDREIVETTIKELSEYLPETGRAGLEHAVVNRIPMAIPCPHPGTEQRRPAVRSGIGRLFLSGDWLRTHLPCCMESACKAGWMAAEAVLEEAGRPRRLAREHEEIEGLSGLIYQTARRLPWRHRVWPQPIVRRLLRQPTNRL
ncbi:MAG: FAD-dependent oxidoreductase [bacterium]